MWNNFWNIKDTKKNIILSTLGDKATSFNKNLSPLKLLILQKKMMHIAHAAFLKKQIVSLISTPHSLLSLVGNSSASLETSDISHLMAEKSDRKWLPLDTGAK